MKVLLPLLLSLVLVSPALAKDACENTTYKLLDDTFSFGDDAKSAFKKASERFKGSTGHVIPIQDNLFKVMLRNHKTLESILVFSIDGRVTRIMYTYSQEFLQSLGGVVGAADILIPKLRDKYGFLDGDAERVSENKVKAQWPLNNGARMIIILEKDISLRFDCEALEEALRKKKAKSVDFGI